MDKYLLLDFTEPIATITLNRVERHNSLVPELLEGLLVIFEQLSERDDLAALVLQANGRSLRNLPPFSRA
jgi:2-(1,2-epoxy-1,2-dihydrophenyl)acetyl-CoA isomerase